MAAVTDRTTEADSNTTTGDNMRLRSRTYSRPAKIALAGALAFSLVVSACGGTSEDGGGGGGGGPEGKAGQKDELGLSADAGEYGLKDAGEPKRGGKLVYGLEADSNGGFCLSEGQLAISGMMVVRAVYDTLTVPNAEGGYTPYLAKSVEPNDDFTKWTITPRENIKFHDGSPLTAEVIKNNIDAYRGVYEGRSSLLFAFVLGNVKDTKVEGDTVVVTAEKPWANFPAFLFSSSRFGIMAQKQLDSDKCDRELIGTGPFKFESWVPNQQFEAVRNEDYWQIAPDGEPYPYADAIEFQPILDGGVRDNSLESGDINVMHQSNADTIGNKWLPQAEAGEQNMFVSEDSAELAFVQLNHTEAPFDDLRMRKAMAMSGDREEFNKLVNGGFNTVVDQPFAKDSIAFVDGDVGFPKYDVEGAKKLIADYEKENGAGSADFTLTATSDPTVQRLAQLVQQAGSDVGIKVGIATREQAALVEDAIGKKYQAMLFRNYPGGDPDLNYVWWYDGTKNPVNFAGFNDPEVNKALDEGRSETDPAKRKEIYQRLSKRMASQVHGIWSWLTLWAIVEAPNVHNVLGPPLPGEDPSKPGDATTDDPARQPSTGLAQGHSLLGMWIDK